MRRFLTLGAILIAGNGSIALSQSPSSEKSTPTEVTAHLGLEELLARWGRQPASRSLEVTFSQVDQSAKWDDKSYEGTFTLGSAGRSCLERERLKDGVRIPEERLIRNGDSVYQYRFETKQILEVHLSSSPAGKEQGLASRLRSALFSPFLESGYGRGDALPFLFVFNEADARAAFRIELHEETAEDAAIKFTPLTPTGKLMFDAVFVQLDKSRYLPKVIYLVKPGGKEQSIYRFTNFVRNGLVENDRFEFKPLEGWHVHVVDVPRSVAPATKR